jgi:diguanylate cyclase (GGDEF)-like protein
MNRDQQAMRDFAKRTKRGVYLHLPLWLLMCSFVGMAESAPLTFWINCAGFASTTVLRALFFTRSAGLIATPTHHGKRALQIQAFIPCMHWSVLAALSTREGVLQPLMLPLTLVMAGLATAGSVVLSIDFTVRRWFPIVSLVPMAAGYLLYQPRPMNLLIVTMVVIVIIYVAAATRLVHDDYWEALEGRNLLQERAKNFESLSMTDVLTQISNRLHFERCLKYSWMLAAKEQHPLSLLLIDLDHFKKINDTYGHSIGDECLKAAAQAIVKGMVRDTDRVARWGGEEFIVLLPNVDRDAAQAVAERVLKGVANTSVPFPGGTVRLACSIGVATLNPNDRREPKNLINDADRALYEAKTQGRNRVVAAAA